MNLLLTGYECKPVKSQFSEVSGVIFLHFEKVGFWWSRGFFGGVPGGRVRPKRKKISKFLTGLSRCMRRHPTWHLLVHLKKVGFRRSQGPFGHVISSELMQTGISLTKCQNSTPHRGTRSKQGKVCLLVTGELKLIALAKRVYFLHAKREGYQGFSLLRCA